MVRVLIRWFLAFLYFHLNIYFIWLLTIRDLDHFWVIQKPFRVEYQFFTKNLNIWSNFAFDIRSQLFSKKKCSFKGYFQVNGLLCTKLPAMQVLHSLGQQLSPKVKSKMDNPHIILLKLWPRWKKLQIVKWEKDLLQIPSRYLALRKYTTQELFNNLKEGVHQKLKTSATATVLSSQLVFCSKTIHISSFNIFRPELTHLEADSDHPMASNSLPKSQYFIILSILTA